MASSNITWAAVYPGDRRAGLFIAMQDVWLLNGPKRPAVGHGDPRNAPMGQLPTVMDEFGIGLRAQHCPQGCTHLLMRPSQATALRCRPVRKSRLMSSYVGEASTADVASHEAAPPRGWSPWTTPPAAGHDGSRRGRGTTRTRY